MHKIISLFLGICLSVSVVSADSIDKTVKSLKFNPEAVSVSIKDVNTGHEIYSLNKNTPRNPASTLKLVTLASSLDSLGQDYKFSTKLYKSTNNDLYLKLGADPLLKSSDLGILLETAKQKNIIEPKNFYIDSSVFDDIEWGEGWQWDDSLNPYMPKFSAYNIDKNILKVEVNPNVNALAPVISVKPYYPVPFMNFVDIDFKSGQNHVSFERNSEIASNIINVSGVVSKPVYYSIPVDSPKRNFMLRLDEAIRSKKIEYYSPIRFSSLPQKNVYLVDEVTHDMNDAVLLILKNSDNLVAETVFKLAGAQFASGKGTISNSSAMLNSYLDKIGVNHENVKIVDGSGVSKNNIVTSSFMADFLSAKSKDADFEYFKDSMASPGEGTLKTRMLYFGDNLKAKTGTLSDVSAIAGYIKSRKGKLYAFDIMIKDAKSSPNDKKNLEEQILRQVYLNY